MNLIEEAKALGFSDAAVISTDQLVFVPEYRVFCEDNLCGNYDKNPACPPQSGTVEEMKEHALKISSAAIALIKKHQGLSLEKYRDEKGLWVIGYGHVIRDQEHFHGPVTPLEAETLLREDIRLCEALLRENMTRPLTQQQHDALVMMIFSFGEITSLPNALFQAVARV